MLKGKTRSGFEYEVAPERLNNYELVEALAEVDSNPLLLPKVVNLLLGQDLKNKLADHLRDESGMVPMDAVSDELAEIFTSGQQVKNS